MIDHSHGFCCCVWFKVDLRSPVAATDSELRDMSYILPSAMVDSTDEAVRAIAERALGELFV